MGNKPDISENLKFIRQKDYKLIKAIGQGGTGKTILIRDEAINEVFVCKKYSTFQKSDQSLYYDYFIDEIKILHNLYHKNIVRVFNYYLYPEKNTGYILMEFVDGEPVDAFLHANPNKVEDVFIQMIDGFRYLEEKGILHRDIRPENILVSKEGILKIIDFGFGKITDFETNNKSISLNWRYSIPDEFANRQYDSKTEIFFAGKLIEEILSNLENVNFKHSGIVSKMINPNPQLRISTFFDIYRLVISSHSVDVGFTNKEKNAYLEFAKYLKAIYSKISEDSKYHDDVSLVIKNLEELYRNSILEQTIQDPNKFARIFINGKYIYYPKKEIPVSVLYEMLQLLKAVSDDKKKIILNNLWERLDSIDRYGKYVVNDDDLPF